MAGDDQGPAGKASRIQQRNRKRILEAALDVFSKHGFRGATLDQIAEQCGMSKPNIIYYFSSKEAIHTTLLNRLMDEWTATFMQIDPSGAPLEEIMRYVHRKLEMSREYPRESRLFANEIIQGAPHMAPFLKEHAKPKLDELAGTIDDWGRQGKINPVDAYHLIFSIWATTQHYADFDAQIQIYRPGEPLAGARAYIDTLFRRLLTPA